MQIKPYKKNEQPTISHQILENNLYKEYLTQDRRVIKKMKLNTAAYNELMRFHNNGEYLEYLISLDRMMEDDSIINVPKEVYTYLGYIRSLVQDIETGFMTFDKLAPKLDLDVFLDSLSKFYDELYNIDYLDLSQIGAKDIIYGGKVEIFNPEFLQITSVRPLTNIAHINKVILNGIYGLDHISECDASIKDLLELSLNGEFGADVVLKEISILESKKRGKTKYLKHINNGYIK